MDGKLRSEVPTRGEWLGAGALLLLPLLLLFVPLFLSSENLHTGGESTTYDRIAMANRSFWGQPGASFWKPGTWNLEPNFPLGTAFVFALPRVLHVDSIPFLRLHSALWAILSSIVLLRVLSPSLRPLLAGLAAAAIWFVPTFARGAVVTGEEAPFTGLLLLGLLGLALGKERPRALVWSCLAVNGTVLFRLDAMFIPPAFALAALFLIRGKRSLLYAVCCSGTTLLHLGVTWALRSSPFDFARNATRVTQGIALDDSVGALDFLSALSSYLGGGVALGLAGLGLATLLWRGDRAARLFAALILWLALGYCTAAMLPVLEVDLARYFVPLLAMLAACVPCVALLLPDRRALRLATGALGVVLLASVNTEAIRSQALEARGEPGLAEASSWLSSCAPHLKTFTTHRAPALQLLGGRRASSVHLLNSRWNSAAPASMVEELRSKEAELLVLVGSGPEVQEFRAARAAGWRYVWQEGQIVIYGKLGDTERAALMACGR